MEQDKLYTLVYNAMLKVEKVFFSHNRGSGRAKEEATEVVVKALRDVGIVFEGEAKNVLEEKESCTNHNCGCKL